MASAQPYFGAWDYVVVVLVLLISSAIGLYYRFTGGKQKTMQEYLHADKKMSVTPVAFSLMASFMSAVTLLGVSSENYTFGIQFIVINLSYGLGTPIAAYLYLPVFFRLQATSAYEYLEKRFGPPARTSASLIYCLQMVMYMGIVLYAPALALEALTGISRTAAVLSVGLVCTFYSGVGGMKAVLVTDVFQSLLMFAAVFSVIICGLMQTGSFAEIWRIAELGNRTEILDFSVDPTVRHSWWSLILGGMVTFLSLYGVNQTQIQRYLTVADLKTAQKTIWLNWPILSLLSLSTSFSGLAIYSKYYKCDPVTAGYISSSDQLMPYYVIDSMGSYPGLSGLFVAGIFSAALSSISACVNSLAAITMEDYHKPLHKKCFKKPLTDTKTTLLTKLWAFIFGLLSVAVAFLAQFVSSLLQMSLTIFGSVGGPLLGLFTLGMVFPSANQKGALTGLFVGLACSFWSAFGQPRPAAPKLPMSIEGCDSSKYFQPISFAANTTVHVGRSASSDGDYFWLYKISYMYNGVFGLLVTLIVGYVMSYVTARLFREPVQRLDPNLFMPPVARRLEKRLEKPMNLRGIPDKDLKNCNQKEVLTLEK